jgi:hypothetical protein
LNVGAAGLLASQRWRRVHDWDKGAVNTKADVEIVQQMLRNASMILRDLRVDPGDSDGAIAKDAQDSETVKAIEAFQSRFLTAADGMIDVGGRTWRALVEVLDGDEQDETSSMEAHGAPEFFFPFDRLPSVNWTGVPRSFGSNRGGGRAHMERVAFI